MSGGPLTLGTAGHIDHGKTTLIRALTGIDCDRLPEERARGITIELGYAVLQLPGGRRLSVIDVPGHERLVRVMVSGATGIDLFLLVIAADDGVMPQTVEHARVLRALGISRGVVAVTRADLADPGPALRAAAHLMPQAPAVACSARTGSGLPEVVEALDAVARALPGRPPDDAPAALHIDRVFSIRGAGTVVTGTLWAGRISVGERLTLLPAGRSFRVRGLQVHDESVATAPAGQRVAVNLAGADRRAVRRGDALVAAGSAVAASYRIEVALTHGEVPEHRERVQVHHGTRDVPARVRRLDGEHWQLRVEQPLLAADGDRLVLRRISPPDTLGGGVILTARAGGRRSAAPSEHPVAAARDAPAPATVPPTVSLEPGALALEQRLRDAGHEPLREDQLGELAPHLPALRESGRAIRIGRAMYAHPDAVEAVAELVRGIISREGSLTLARLRDELGSSRRCTQALLEHLDGARVTRRLPDDRRVLRPPRS
ncbi:MAG TPA: selenocysteine-specific translation elongation factor [Solirubrobacteraceae bacterium]|nr:selenocysteine-specific translation elongation factor [Solirubrobacteraceae bacterium]